MASVARVLGYNSTVESIYTINHPDVIKWTNNFHDKMNVGKIFEKFMTNLPRDISTSCVVATGWHAFSMFMPQFLCQAAAMVSNNLARHYIVQGAFEELGMRDNTQIHPDLFWRAAESVELSINNIVAAQNSLIHISLKSLRERLLSYKSDMQIFGVLLGLEIPAIENIETVFASMAYNEATKLILEKNRFFIIHREIEFEHIRLTVSNFLRFQNSKQDIDNFILGFMDGIQFWDDFWKGMKSYITW